MDRLDDDTLPLVLTSAGAWPFTIPSYCRVARAHDGRRLTIWKPAVIIQRSCLDVCRSWRDCFLCSPDRMAQLLREVHGPEEALIRAAGCTSRTVDQLALLRETLKTARADCKGGKALVIAAHLGNEAAVKLLLSWPDNAPRADCNGGEALFCAASAGHEAVVRLLLESCHPPRADLGMMNHDGEVLARAAMEGHEAVVLLLLQHWPIPRARDLDDDLQYLASAVVMLADEFRSLDSAKLAVMKLVALGFSSP